MPRGDCPSFSEYPARTQERSDFPGVYFVAVVHRPRQSVDLGGIAEDRAAEALRNDAVVLDVVVTKESAEANRRHQEDDDRGSNHRVARQPATGSGRRCPLRSFPSSGS